MTSSETVKLFCCGFQYIHQRPMSIPSHIHSPEDILPSSRSSGQCTTVKKTTLRACAPLVVARATAQLIPIATTKRERSRPVEHGMPKPMVGGLKGIQSHSRIQSPGVRLPQMAFCPTDRRSLILDYP